MQATLETLFTAADRVRLQDAARLRTSCRTFAAAPDAADLAALAYAVGRYQLPGVRIVFAPVADGFFTPARNGLRITGCRMVAVVSVTDKARRSLLHAGIMGECLVLEAAARGLGSCWVSGTYDFQAAQAYTQPDEQRVCVIALGKPLKPLSPPLIRERKPLERLCQGNFRLWPEMLQTAAQLVQIAPSAMNMQLCSLSLGEKHEFILHFTERNLPDAGIALCHAELVLDLPHAWHVDPDCPHPRAWAVAR